MGESFQQNTLQARPEPPKKAAPLPVIGLGVERGERDELAFANSYLQNLTNSTDIVTVFIDSDLRIKQNTPRILNITFTARRLTPAEAYFDLR